MTMGTPLTPERVLQWEQRRRDAMLAGDAAALRELISGQVIYVHSSATRDTRDSYLKKISTGALRYLHLVLSDMQVQMVEGAALVTGRMQATVSRDGKEIPVRSAFLTVWVPEHGVWRLRAHQGTPVND
ncbi:MAG TPA: DUF4440 domain-containing protein [Curvibacter sp.]|nr:DUF4440 domain-containing protein [Curvibacter sp.]